MGNKIISITLLILAILLSSIFSWLAVGSTLLLIFNISRSFESIFLISLFIIVLICASLVLRKKKTYFLLLVIFSAIITVVNMILCSKINDAYNLRITENIIVF